MRRNFLANIGRLLAGIFTLSAFRGAAQTRVLDSQVAYPAGTAQPTIYINTMNGRKFAVPDASLAIDTSVNPPTIRATQSAAQVVPQLLQVVVGTSGAAVTLPAVPRAGYPVKVWRNGLFSHSVDFTLTGATITFAAIGGNPMPLAGDFVDVEYY